MLRLAWRGFTNILNDWYIEPSFRYMHYKIKLNHIKESCEIIRLADDAQGFVAALLCGNFVGRDVVFVAENDAQIEFIEKQIRFFP